MYTYKNMSILSIEKSIVKTNNVNIATIEKYYSNVFQQILGTISFGQIYNKYLIKDLKNDNFVKVKEIPSAQEKEYKIEYYCNNNSYDIYLNKYGLVNNEKVGTFQFKNDVFKVYSDQHKVIHIAISDNEEKVATWKNQGSSNIIKENSAVFLENALLFIAIFHVFSRNTLPLNKILMPMTLLSK